MPQTDFPQNNLPYISLREASKICRYSQEYLSLRARQGKLKAVKFGRNWVTTRQWLQDYLLSVTKYEQGDRKQKIVVKKISVKTDIKTAPLGKSNENQAAIENNFFPIARASKDNVDKETPPPRKLPIKETFAPGRKSIFNTWHFLLPDLKRVTASIIILTLLLSSLYLVRIPLNQFFQGWLFSLDETGKKIQHFSESFQVSSQEMAADIFFASQKTFSGVKKICHNLKKGILALFGNDYYMSQPVWLATIGFLFSPETWRNTWQTFKDYGSFLASLALSFQKQFKKTSKNFAQEIQLMTAQFSQTSEAFSLIHKSIKRQANQTLEEFQVFLRQILTK